MTQIRKLSLLFALTSPTFSFAASVPKTILPDNVITCQVNANCTNKTLYGRTYKVINTPRFTVMVAVSQEGAYTRADVRIANNTIMSQSLTPEDFRVEVVTPKPKVLLYVPPTELKDLSPATQTASAPQTASAAPTVPPAPVAPTAQAADANQTPNIDQLYEEAKRKAALKEEADKVASQRDLSATSLPPNEVALGRVFFERDKHAQLVNVVLPIAGLVFEFPYTLK
ncbi:hypothetical protein [Tunturiibacter lichenicola]|uniref:hypothetical protein n=1 Tax=Tunturiibacter lichenicola TaxID=2051959 RepID=UPI0021B3F107|nr:hypothetical protein [Edaphobacter lichenicola]